MAIVSLPQESVNLSVLPAYSSDLQVGQPHAWDFSKSDYICKNAAHPNYVQWVESHESVLLTVAPYIGTRDSFAGIRGSTLHQRKMPLILKQICIYEG